MVTEEGIQGPLQRGRGMDGLPKRRNDGTERDEGPTIDKSSSGEIGREKKEG